MTLEVHHLEPRGPLPRRRPGAVRGPGAGPQWPRLRRRVRGEPWRARKATKHTTDYRWMLPLDSFMVTGLITTCGTT